MVEFLWTDSEEDYQIDDLPDAASSAPTAAQWISMHKDLQTRAAWRNMRDERVLKKVTEQTAIATRIAEENKRLRAEEKMQKDRGPKAKEPYDPGPRICPECKKNTWDLLTLGTCDACGMWKASRDSFKKTGAQRDNYYNDQSSDEENQKAPQAETKAKATAKTKAAAGAGRPHRFDNKQQQAAYSSSSSSRWQPPPPPRPPASSAWQ